MKKANKNNRENLLRLLADSLAPVKKSKKAPDRMKAKYKVTKPNISLSAESKRKSRFSK